jgi:hypothetical protein
MTPSGTFTEFVIPAAAGRHPYDIVPGATGERRLWFTTSSSAGGRINFFDVDMPGAGDGAVAMPPVDAGPEPDSGISSIAVTPNDFMLTVATSRIMTATATAPDGAMSDVTAVCRWSTGDPNVARMSDFPGKSNYVVAVFHGMTTVICTIGTQSGFANITVP